MQNKWVVPMSTLPGASMRLFCFPHSGGSARAFKEWPNHLPSSIEVCGIQYPGRGNRFTEPQITEMGAMVDAVLNALKPFLNKPFAFFGHSLGGGIALDTAKALQQAGTPVKHMFISGRRAAHLPRNRKPLAHLPEDAFRKEVFSMGGMPKEITEHPELMELLSPILRADLSISEKYTFDPAITLNCPLTALGGVDDHLVEESAIAAWSEHTNAHFGYEMFPGGHFYIDTSREMLLQRVRKDLGI